MSKAERNSTSLQMVKVLIEQWRHHYNTVRPHSSLGYRHLHRRLLSLGRPIWMERQLCSSLNHAGTKYPAGQLRTSWLTNEPAGMAFPRACTSHESPQPLAGAVRLTSFPRRYP